MPKFGMPLLKNKDDLARLKVLVKIFFDIHVKSHSHRKVMCQTKCDWALQNVHVKNGKSLSKQTEVTGQTQIHVKNSVNLTLRSKFNVVLGSWMYTTHRLIVIHPCAKYGKPMSNHKKVMGRTRICTDRQTEWFLYTPLNFVRRGYN